MKHNIMAETQDDTRREILGDLFQRWDLNGDQAVGFGELMQVLQSSEKSGSKDALKWVKKVEAQITQGREANKRKRGSVTQLKAQSGGYINFSEADGEPSLDPEAFTGFLMAITEKMDRDEFEEFVEFCKSGVEAAQESTHGSKMKKDIWKMFQLLDLNMDGFVDLTELEVLLAVESKADKKHVAKWKAQLLNKTRDEEKIKEEDVEEDERGIKYEMKLSLNDFQAFLGEYVGEDEARLTNLLTGVESAVQERVQVKYILEFKIQDIMNEIMGDLLQERPRDVLAGVSRSVARLQRTGKFPKMLPPRKSLTKDDSDAAGAFENKDSEIPRPVEEPSKEKKEEAEEDDDDLEY